MGASIVNILRRACIETAGLADASLHGGLLLTEHVTQNAGAGVTRTAPAQEFRDIVENGAVVVFGQGLVQRVGAVGLGGVAGQRAHQHGQRRRDGVTRCFFVTSDLLAESGEIRSGDLFQQGFHKAHVGSSRVGVGSLSGPKRGAESHIQRVGPTGLALAEPSRVARTMPFEQEGVPRDAC